MRETVEKGDGVSERRLEQLAADQHGVIGIEQAHEAGLTNSQISHRLRTTRWRLVRPRVYRLAGTPLTWKARLMAECLAAGEDALASHRAAARLWDLRGLRSDSIEITVGRHRLGATRSARLHRCNLLVAEDRRQVDSIPVTGPELTLLHLAGQLPLRQTDGLIDDALRKGLTTLPRLRWRLGVLGRRGRNGSGRLRALLDARDPENAKAQSSLERAFLSLVRTTDLPKPHLQHLVSAADGAFLARVDAAWPAEQLAVELDGFEFHSHLADWSHDYERQAELQALGWTVLRFTWWNVHERPAWVLKTLNETFWASRARLERARDARNV